MSARRRPVVEILYFDGCPNHEPALAKVERVDGELGTDADVRLVNVPDQETATRRRACARGGRDPAQALRDREDGQARPRGAATLSLDSRVLRTDGAADRR